MKQFLIGAAAFCACLLSASLGFAESAPAKSLCSQLDDVVEGSFKVIAQEDAESVADNSAPRATLSAIKINNLLLVAAMNLQIMRDNGCTPKKGPYSQSRYVLPAMRCHTDMLKLRLGQEVVKMPGSSLPASCDFQTWKPLGQEEAKP